MTQIFNEDGAVTPVTLIEAGPVTVTHIKTKDQDGYDAVQIGYGKAKKLNKPQAGHLKGLNNLKHLKEFKPNSKFAYSAEAAASAAKAGQTPDSKKGDILDASIFSIGDIVKVSGISKGKGFQGVVKRHGFHGMPASHGHHHVLRHGGSIGQRFPQHTLKGMRMSGRMGGKRVTTRGLKIMSIDKEKNLLTVKGAVPGRRGTLLEIQKL